MNWFTLYCAIVYFRSVNIYLDASTYMLFIFDVNGNVNFINVPRVTDYLCGGLIQFLSQFI